MKELCILLGMRLFIRINYSPGGPTHICTLDPERSMLIIDGVPRKDVKPFGAGFSEEDSILKLIIMLHTIRDPGVGPHQVRTLTIRCRSIYDNEVRDMPINDLTVP